MKMHQMKMHRDNGHPLGYILNTALCGFWAAFNGGRRAYITKDTTKVTCKTCLKIMGGKRFLPNKYQNHYNPKNKMASMPEEYLGQFYNGCIDPCDMLAGPCACGATHHQEEWPAKIQIEVFGSVSAKKSILKRTPR